MAIPVRSGFELRELQFNFKFKFRISKRILSKFEI